jgi:hypothetical protein
MHYVKVRALVSTRALFAAGLAVIAISALSVVVIVQQMALQKFSANPFLGLVA